MLYSFFWSILRFLKSMCLRIGTLSVPSSQMVQAGRITRTRLLGCVYIWVISWVVLLWYDACFMLNMFRMLMHPSSGACDLFVELFHGLYCSGTMRVGITLWIGWGGVVSGCRLKLACLYSTVTWSVASSVKYFCGILLRKFSDSEFLFSPVSIVPPMLDTHLNITVNQKDKRARLGNRSNIGEQWIG